MYKNQDQLSILQKQFEGAANQFPEMVYYTAMLSFEDYKTHGDLKRNVRFHGAENVSEVMKKHIDPWQVDLLGKEIHAWDNGRYVSPVVRDGPSNHYHWLVRPIGQSWDTLPAMQRIHTLTRQASIILKRLYGTIGGVSRASHRQSNYLSHWFMSMRDILICEKHEYSFIQEELEYLNKALHIALKTHDIELLQKLLSERPPTFDGISDVFLKSAFVCTILIDRLREKDINKPNVTEDGGNVNEEPTPPKEFVTPEAEQSASQKSEGTGRGTKSPQFMSVAELAECFEVDNKDALRKRLERFRKRNALNSDAFIEAQDRGVRKPKYLYNVKMAVGVIEDLKRTQASVKRPSGKK